MQWNLGSGQLFQKYDSQRNRTGHWAHRSMRICGPDAMGSQGFRDVSAHASLEEWVLFGKRFALQQTGPGSQ